jgi:hypothetical protein
MCKDFCINVFLPIAPTVTRAGHPPILIAEKRTTAPNPTQMIELSD